MKKIGFIGAYDKSDLIINIAKILQLLNYKVVVVDTTLLQKTKYIVPAINPTKSYITNFEDIDFAVGFYDLEEIAKYFDVQYEKLGEEKGKIYDYMLIDIDSAEVLENIEIEKMDNKYFITSFDSYSLKKGIDIFQNLETPINITKVLFLYEISREREELLNSISLDYNLNWNDFTLYFQISCEDNKILQENEIFEKIKFKKLSGNYKDSLTYLILDIDKSQSPIKIRKLMRD